MKPIKINITNYSALNETYKALIAPFYRINNNDGQWIEKLKQLLITALSTLPYDEIEESNVSSTRVDFAFKLKGVLAYTIQCSK